MYLIRGSVGAFYVSCIITHPPEDLLKKKKKKKRNTVMSTQKYEIRVPSLNFITSSGVENLLIHK